MDEAVEAAKKKARETGKRVEVSERNTETSTVFANPDGKTLRMEIHAQPIRVKTAKGDGFTPIDTTLVEENGLIKPKAIKGDLTLSAGADTILLKSRTAQGTAEIAAPSGKLPKPKLAGNTATYHSAYGNGMDLVVTTTPTGFRQKIVIQERPSGPVTFRVPVDLPKGMSFSKNAAGQPTVLGQDGKKILDIRPVPLLDATAADANAPIDAGKVGKAGVAVEGNGSTLVYTPDAAFLADPAVTYPVTLSAADSDWWECTIGRDPCTSPPGGVDTFVNDDIYYDSWNNFNLDRILVGKSNNGAVRWRSYIRFPDIPEDSPLRGGTVQNADLILWNHLSNDCGDHVGSGIVARRVTSDWDEMTMQWTSQPSVTTVGQNVEYGAYSPNCTSGAAGWAGKEWYLVHYVNGIVQAWANGEPNYGFQLAAANESDITNWRRYRTQDYYCCSEGAHPPKLTVDFEPAPKILTYFSETGPRRTSPPTFEEATALHREPAESIPDRPGTTVEEIIASEGTPTVPYEIGPDQLGPLPGEDWSTPQIEDEDGPGSGDETPPALIEVSPERGATDVSIATQIKAVFSEPIWEAQLKLKDPAGNVLAGTTQLDSERKVLTFTPDQSLSYDVRYIVEVSNAHDADGNMMTVDAWSFSTPATAHWKFDEGSGTTAGDSSGNGHHATLSDTVAWIPGKSGNAVSNEPSQAQIAASQRAAHQGKVVAVADETTATSITYAQPDGKTFTTQIAAGPVRTRQNGTWVPIDPTLAEQGGVLKPKTLADGVAVEVSTGGTGAFVRMTADGRRYALTWPARLPKPTVKGNVATYTDAAGKGADLVVTVLPTGFRHDVVLRERPAKPLELRIGVDTGGLTLSKGNGGRLLLTDTGTGKNKDKGKKKLVASAPQPVMWDASAGARLAKGRLPQARHAKIATDVVTTGGRTELVLKPDHTFLSDPATVYPVRVDPTTTLPFNHDVEVLSTDTAGLPADPTGGYLMAGRMPGLLARVHLRFDTAALTGATVSDAKLSLNNIDAPACGAAVGAGIQVRRLTGAWDENNLYWANKPPSTTEDAQINRAAINESCATWPGPMDWNVTGIAQDWAAGAANHGLVLQHPNETNTNDNYRVFTSAEDTDFATPPTLTVTTTGPASAPTVSGLAITPAQAAGGVTTVTSLTPQLAATVSDTIGGTLTGQFEIEHDPAAPTGQGAGQIWAGASAAVASGSQAAAGVPAGKLTDGWKIRWRARAVNAAAATSSAWSDWLAVTVDVPDPVGQPTVSALQVNPSQQLDGTTVTSTLIPSLLAQVSDPAGGSLRAEFEVEHDPAATEGQGSGQIWAGAVDNVTSGSQAGITVPDGKLTDGWLVRWRARAIAGALSSAWSDWQQVKVDVIQPGEKPLAQTTGPVIRTDESFTVTAWLRWSDKEGNYTVVEQRGTHQAPFRLGNTPDRGLVFTFTSADAADATVEGVVSDVEPPVGEWFHLAGVYDAAARTATLYLNGDAVKTASISFPAWNANGPMALGASVRGDLDDVWVHQRALSVSDLATQHNSVATQTSATVGSSGVIDKEESRTAQTMRATQEEFPYDRHTLEWCEEKRESEDDDDRLRDNVWGEVRPYSGCTARFHSWLIWTVDTEKSRQTGRTIVFPTPAWMYFHVSVAIHTYAGNETGAGVQGGTAGRLPRDIKVWTKLSNVFIPGDDDPVVLGTLKLRVRAKAGKETSNCAQIEGPANGERSGDVPDYDEEWRTEFVFRSSGALFDSCTIRPWLTLQIPAWPDKSVELWDIPRNPTATNDNAAKVRCDSLSKHVYKGGCVLVGANAVYTMHRTDPFMGDVPKHIHDAFYSPHLTAPHFKDTNGSPIAKRVPGNYATGGSALTYVSKAAKAPDGRTYRGKNKYRKGVDCREWFPGADDDDYPDPNDVPGELQCDEFPFASTKEGPGSAGYNYSIRALRRDQNENAGTDLGIFYARYRFLNGSQFWVNIK
ncbi:DNRLRE domain-containing protein [Streptosporangium sp. CA-115845]|uniref:DNRLRE domain-containing protein n=1 Tax=Streptosporangium sp. CA-115845 TaxID=3240071 RepID=UPI003D8C008C